jgi:hypothetical protein
MKKKIEYIKLIRKELLKERPVWEFIQGVSKIAGLQDTAYRDKIERHDINGLLRDYLLDLKYWKNRRAITREELERKILEDNSPTINP